MGEVSGQALGHSPREGRHIFLDAVVGGVGPYHGELQSYCSTVLADYVLREV